jgi:hypothetical protein
MILSTKGADMVVARAFGKNEVSCVKLASIIEALATDPALGSVPKEAFIISSDDLRNKRDAAEFFEACQHKHPNCFVIIIAKDKNAERDCRMPGVDQVVYRPRPEDISKLIIDNGSAIAQKTVVPSAFDAKPEGIEHYVPPLSTFEVPPPLDEEESSSSDFDPNLLTLDFEAETPEECPEEPITRENVRSPISKQIFSTNKMADVTNLVNDLTANRVISEMLEREGRAASLADLLGAIKEKIYAILLDNSSGDDMEVKMEKIRAAIHDRSEYQSAFSSAVAQYAIEIIDTICVSVKDKISDRLEALDKAIYNASITDDVSSAHANVAALQQARANIMLEVGTLDLQLKTICAKSVELTQDVATRLVSEAADFAGAPMLNELLKRDGTSVVSAETIAAVGALMARGAEGVDKLREASFKVEELLHKINTVLKLDKETIQAQLAVVKYLQANNIEDTIIASSLLKKSLRIWTGVEGSGRTIVPYVMSRMKSMANANVLLVDLTGTAKFDDYGIRTKSLDDYLSQRHEERFCVVQGTMPESTEMIQRLYTQLYKAADFYRVINVVVSTEQPKALEMLSEEVLCVNYICDMQMKNIRTMKQFIKDTEQHNVGQRVVLNKCSMSTYSILEALGVSNRIDVAMVSIPVLHAIEDCALTGTDPTLVTSVSEGFKEANKYA